MLSFLTLFHVLIAVVLVVVVLMQSQQSMNLSGMFGGASQSALGSQPQSVLSRATTVLAVIFMVTSLLYSLVPVGDQSILSPGAVETEGPSPEQSAPAGDRTDGAPEGSPEGSPGPAPTGP